MIYLRLDQRDFYFFNKRKANFILKIKESQASSYNFICFASSSQFGLIKTSKNIFQFFGDLLYHIVS